MTRRYQARTDASQAAIVEALRAAGALVWPLHAVGHGMADLLVYRPATNRFHLIEVKEPHGSLTGEQVAFQQLGWPVHVCRTPEEALEAIGAM